MNKICLYVYTGVLTSIDKYVLHSSCSETWLTIYCLYIYNKHYRHEPLESHTVSVLPIKQD